MVTQKSVADQLKKVGFSQHAWGRAEVRELPNIILPDEEIFECVNGIYEGGFALLVATNFRVLLIDKKPFNYLTVEDLRFDMINEIDYNHRAFGAYVDISTGNRDLKFRSYNQPRLRRLISHVQRRMAEIKQRADTHQEGQKQHLEQINDRLQAYLMAQYHHQQELQTRLREAQTGKTGGQAAVAIPEAPKPSPELSDFLLAQGLLAEYKAKTGGHPVDVPDLADIPEAVQVQPTPTPVNPARDVVVVGDDPGPAPAQASQTQGGPSTGGKGDDLYAEGVREVFGKHQQHQHHVHLHAPHVTFDINPLKIAYARLPLAMRNRKFGRPSLHAHSQAEGAVPALESIAQTA